MWFKMNNFRYASLHNEEMWVVDVQLDATKQVFDSFLGFNFPVDVTFDLVVLDSS
jgi:hypothetical protein